MKDCPRLYIGRDPRRAALACFKATVLLPPLPPPPPAAAEGERAPALPRLPLPSQLKAELSKLVRCPARPPPPARPRPASPRWVG